MTANGQNVKELGYQLLLVGGYQGIDQRLRDPAKKSIKLEELHHQFKLKERIHVPPTITEILIAYIYALDAFSRSESKKSLEAMHSLITRIFNFNNPRENEQEKKKHKLVVAELLLNANIT